MKNDLKNNLKIFTIGTYLSKFIMFILLPYLTTTYSVKEYGKIDFLQTTINILFPIISLAIVEAIIRFGLNSQEEKKVVMNTSLAFAFITNIIILFIISLFYYLKYDYIYIIAGVFIGTQLLRETLKQISRIYNKIIIFMLSDFIYVIVFVISLYLLNLIKVDVNNYFLSMICGFLVDSFFIITFSKLFKQISFVSINILYFKKMMMYSIPLVPNTIFMWVILFSNRYIILHFAGLTALGLFSVAIK